MINIGETTHLHHQPLSHPFLTINFGTVDFLLQDVIEKFGLRDVRTKAIEAKLTSLSQVPAVGCRW